LSFGFLKILSFPVVIITLSVQNRFDFTTLLFVLLPIS